MVESVCPSVFGHKDVKRGTQRSTFSFPSSVFISISFSLSLFLYTDFLLLFISLSFSLTLFLSFSLLPHSASACPSVACTNVFTSCMYLFSLSQSLLFLHLYLSSSFHLHPSFSLYPSHSISSHIFSFLGVLLMLFGGVHKKTQEKISLRGTFSSVHHVCRTYIMSAVRTEITSDRRDSIFRLRNTSEIRDFQSVRRFAPCWDHSCREVWGSTPMTERHVRVT